MLGNPQAQSGQIPGSNGAPYVVLGDQWIGYDDINYVTRKVRNFIRSLLLIKSPGMIPSICNFERSHLNNNI